MIITIFLVIVISLFGSVFQFFPQVTALPFGIDAILVQGMGYVYFLKGIFPPLGIMLTGFLFVIGFKVVMLLFKMIPVVGNAAKQ